MGKLTGKVAVITGGTTGIGFATAKLFIDEGATVVVTGKNPATLEAARRELGSRAEVVASDATRVTDLERLFAGVKSRHGRVDVLFANAGGATLRPLADVDEANFDEMVALNLKSTYFTVQKAAPLLPDGASIILNTSIAHAKGFATTSVYAATKAGVRQLARSLGAELLERRIRVNAISPGPIDTPVFGKLGLAGDAIDGFKNTMRDLVPMKRI